MDRTGNIAPYANHGDFVDIAAPGSAIVPFKDRSHLVTGTSASTAWATGMAAGISDQQRATAMEAEAAVRKNLAIKAAAPR
jgi:hypothetical protein